jgi:hypothetical protein
MREEAMNAGKMAAAAPLPILLMVGATACQGIDAMRKPAPVASQQAQPASPAAAPASEWPATTYSTLVGGWTLTDDQGASCLLVLGAASVSDKTFGADGSACPVKVAAWSYEAPNINLYSDPTKKLGTLRASQNEVAFAGELVISGGGRKQVRLVQAGRSAN